MIDNKIDELFSAVKNSSEYQDYKKVENILKKDKSINILIEEIKSLQKDSVRLEYKNDEYYKEIDKKIELKVLELNKKPVYQEYLNKMNEINDILAMSSKMLEEYVNSKIN
jgi:cell fate (sporulation/competence/biofilm development) regulator YmcA (YheA/YmcA/DUF963 family)